MKGINHGQHPIYLTGSMAWDRRNVYEQDGKFYIKWYGQIVEVERRVGADHYRTVEAY